MTKPDSESEERRRRQSEIADSLKESGALLEIFARIDAGELLTGHVPGPQRDPVATARDRRRSRAGSEGIEPRVRTTCC